MQRGDSGPGSGSCQILSLPPRLREVRAVRLMLAASVPPPPATTESVLPSSCHINVLLGSGQTVRKFCKFTLELSLMISKL